jgi:hypothetical protein
MGLGLIGGLFGATALMDILGLGKSKTKVGQISNLTPEQSQVLATLLGSLGTPPTASQNPLYQQGSDVLSMLLGGGGDQALEAPIMQQYQQDILPSIMERFSGSRGSGSLNQTLSQSSVDLAMQLAGMRSQNRMGALGQVPQYASMPMSDYLNLAGLGLGSRSFDTYQQQATPNMIQSLLAGVAGPVGQSIGQSLGRRFI